MRRGEVWLAQLDKPRPVLVFSVVPWLNEIHIVPLTSTIRGLPSEVAITGMPKQSVANAQRLMLVPKDLLIRQVGTVPAQILDELIDAVCTVLGC